MPLSGLRLLAAVSLPLLAAAAMRPRYGGTLRVEIAAAVQALDPAQPDYDRGREKLARLVFETLVRLDDRGRAQPCLAVSWKQQGTRWQFHLRPGVRWHDGSPLTPSSVSALREWTVAASGDALVIETAAPVGLADFAQLRNALVRRDSDGRIHGTGPFRVAEWEPGRRARFEAHADHWAGRPFLDAVAVEMGRSYQEQLVDLELGRADLVEISPLEARRAVQAGLSVSSSPAAWLIALVFLREHEPRLREAVALSIDRAAIANVLLQRHAAPAGALLPAWLTGYAVVFPTDLRVPPPVKGPVLSVQSDAADPLTRAVAERVAVNVREAGIRLNVSAFGSDARVARVWVGQLEPRQALLDAAEGLGLAGSLRLPLPATLEELHAAERALVEEYRVVPLVHIPEIHAAVPRLRAAAGWRLEDAWLEPR